jgi:hypothetical protein
MSTFSGPLSRPGAAICTRCEVVRADTSVPARDRVKFICTSPGRCFPLQSTTLERAP